MAMAFARGEEWSSAMVETDEAQARVPLAIALRQDRADDDLAELIEAACRDLGELSGAEASAPQPRLMALYDDLDRLAESLRREHDALKLALNDLSAQQRHGRPTTSRAAAFRRACNHSRPAMEFTSYLRFGAALVLVLGLIGIAAWAARRFGLAGSLVQSFNG